MCYVCVSCGACGKSEKMFAMESERLVEKLIQAELENAMTADASIGRTRLFKNDAQAIEVIEEEIIETKFELIEMCNAFYCLENALSEIEKIEFCKEIKHSCERLIKEAAQVVACAEKYAIGLKREYV